MVGAYLEGLTQYTHLLRASLQPAQRCRTALLVDVMHSLWHAGSVVSNAFVMIRRVAGRASQVAAGDGVERVGDVQHGGDHIRVELRAGWSARPASLPSVGKTFSSLRPESSPARAGVSSVSTLSAGREHRQQSGADRGRDCRLSLFGLLDVNWSRSRSPDCSMVRRRAAAARCPAANEPISGGGSGSGLSPERSERQPLSTRPESRSGCAQ